MRLSPLVLLSFLAVAGCVGAGPVSTKIYKEEISSPTPKIRNICPSKEIGHLALCRERQPTPEEFRSLWGQPKEHTFAGNREIMTYNRDLAWRGFVVFAIFPIPLLIPIGHNEVRLDFEHDRLVKVESEHGQGDFAICGFHSEGPKGIGCVMWH
jgi:hypothetical protein